MTDRLTDRATDYHGSIASHGENKVYVFYLHSLFILCCLLLPSSYFSTAYLYQLMALFTHLFWGGLHYCFAAVMLCRIPPLVEWLKSFQQKFHQIPDNGAYDVAVLPGSQDGQGKVCIAAKSLCVCFS